MGRLTRVERPPDRIGATELSHADLRRRLEALEAENTLLRAAQRQVDAERGDVDAARRVVIPTALTDDRPIALGD